MVEQGQERSIRSCTRCTRTSGRGGQPDLDGTLRLQKEGGAGQGSGSARVAHEHAHGPGPAGFAGAVQPGNGQHGHSVTAKVKLRIDGQGGKRAFRTAPLDFDPYYCSAGQCAQLHEHGGQARIDAVALNTRDDGLGGGSVNRQVRTDRLGGLGASGLGPEGREQEEEEGGDSHGVVKWVIDGLCVCFENEYNLLLCKFPSPFL